MEWPYLGAAFIVMSFIEISLLIIPISLFSFLALEYFLLWSFCQKLEVRRSFKKNRYTEGERLRVRYRFNQIPKYRFVLFEDFEGIADSEQVFEIEKEQSDFIEKSFFLDQGFGEFEFRHLKAIVSDPFGFFVFKIDFLQREKIQIYPRVQLITLAESVSLSDARNIGEYEYIKRGISPIFYGLREYRYGDPFKFINWKASAKSSKILVNEYENIQSLEAVIYIDLNPKNHLGMGVNSTWEYCRDLGLSLAQIHSHSNHQLQMMSNDYISENTQASIILEDMRHYLHFCQKEKSVNSRPIAESLSLMEEGVCLSLILPLGVNKESVDMVNEIKRVRHRFAKVDIYYVDAFEAVKKTIAPEFIARVMAEQKNSIDFLEKEKKELISRGINLVVCCVKEPHQIKNQLRSVS